MKVRDLMQTEVMTLSVYDCLDIADDIMRLGRVRHLPVLDGDRLVGMVTQRDLFRAGMSSVLDLDSESNRGWLEKVTVRDVMTKDVTTISSGATVQSAVSQMLDRKIGCLPVVDDGNLLGLLSETDCLAYLSHLLESAGVTQEPPELHAD